MLSSSSFKKLVITSFSVMFCAVLALVNPGKSSATTLPVVHKSGTLSADETWSAGSVYLVDNTVTVPNGITLTIDHGAIVKYASLFSGDITVDGGTLNVTGTAADPVTFTSANDDSAGGDSTNNGATTGSLSDYENAITGTDSAITIFYGTFMYSTIAIYGSAGSLTIGDSSFTHIAQQAITYQSGDLSLQRNSFNLQDGYGSDVVELSDIADLTKVALSGSNTNSFSAIRKGGIALAANGVVPADLTWDVSAISGVLLESNSSYGSITVAGVLNLPVGVTYAANASSNIVVANGGTVNIPAGGTLKVLTHSWRPTGIQVNTGGTLNVNGSSTDPVIFTSSEDDSIGGDTTDDGPSTGTIDDYGTAVVNAGGTLNVSNAVFKYGTGGILSSAGSLSVSDSEFDHIGATAITQQDATPYLERNTFNLQDGYGPDALEFRDIPDLTGIVLSGSNANTFTATRVSGTVVAANGTVPIGSTWSMSPITGATLAVNPISGPITVDGTLNLSTSVTYASNASGNIIVADGGVLNIPASAVIKVLQQTVWHPTAVQVTSGGILNVNGTSTNPVIFTSAEDDSVGGDTTDDGLTNGSIGDYGDAVLNYGGTVNVAYATMKYGSGIQDSDGVVTISHTTISNTTSTLSLNGGDATLSDSSFDGATVYASGGANGLRASFNNVSVSNASVGLTVDGSSKVVFRGSFDNITDKYIKACNWSSNCAVDAAYVDWGSAGGPLNMNPDDNLVCGSVTVAPWVHGGSTYNQNDNPNLYSVRNCDDSSTPDTTVSNAVASFQAGISNREIDCSGGYQDACDAIDRAYACLGGAMSVAQSTTPWPLPGASTADDVNAFGGLVLNGAATYMTSQEVVAPTGFGLGFFNDLIGVAGTLVTMANAYNSCAP